jgi:phosphomannomutase
MLPINSEIFKAYDIRGIYGQDFDNELAYLLGLAFVELRKNDPDYNPNKQLQIAVGVDMRLSSPALKKNLLRGLTAAGATAVDLDLVATPTLYFAVGKYQYDGGIMISASHNPKEWNGFKLVRAQSVPISGETGIKFLKEKILSNRFLLPPTPGEIRENKNALTDEMLYTQQFIDLNKFRPFKIVADTANGMGVSYLQKLLDALPGEFIPLNFKLDGSFPAHEADPLKEENLTQLKETVLKQKADLGLAIDGDGDRIFFVDNLGRTIEPAIIRGLLAKIFLKSKPGAKIGYDVRPGKITLDLIKASGGKPVVTKVGHSLIKEQMLKENIYFAGESSGHFYLNNDIGCFEYPSLMILKLLEELSASAKSVAEQIAPYQKYFASGEINRTVKNKETVFTAIAAKYADAKITKLDGISVAYPDFWFNVRGSNTEPKIRLNLEAVSRELMEAKRDEVLKLIN